MLLGEDSCGLLECGNGLEDQWRSEGVTSRGDTTPAHLRGRPATFMKFIDEYCESSQESRRRNLSLAHLTCAVKSRQKELEY